MVREVSYNDDGSSSTTNSNSTLDLTQFLLNLNKDVTPLVFNLSNEELDKNEKEVLKKGLKFVPTPQKIDRLEQLADFKTLVYKIKWKFATEYLQRSLSRPTENQEKDFISLKTRST